MSTFTFLDGSIVGLYLLATMVVGIMVRKYVGNVEDFLVAGREMHVYLGIDALAATSLTHHTGTNPIPNTHQLPKDFITQFNNDKEFFIYLRDLLKERIQ